MLGGAEEGGGGLVEKKKNNEYNVVILFMRGVPAVPSAYPTRCVGYFNIHPGKKGFLSRDLLPLPLPLLLLRPTV